LPISESWFIVQTSIISSMVPMPPGIAMKAAPYVRFVALPIRWKTLADRRQQATDFDEQLGDRLLVVCEMLEQRALKQAVEQRIEGRRR